MALLAEHATLLVGDRSTAKFNQINAVLRELFATAKQLKANQDPILVKVNPQYFNREWVDATGARVNKRATCRGDGFMKFRLPLGIAALLCAWVTVAEASVVTWRIDFTSSQASGYFEIDPTNFVVPAAAWEPTTFSVIAADININNPGWLFQPIHYTLDNLRRPSARRRHVL